MRPWQAWIIFTLFAAVLLGAMGWTASAVLRLDRTQNAITRQADLEERVRLALWRMESAIAPLIARESSRPYYVYTDYYPVEQPPSANPVGSNNSLEALFPWPLQSDASPHIMLYFQLAADGTITSPQSPAGLTTASLAGRFSDERLAVIKSRLGDLKRTIKFEELNGRLSYDDAIKVKFGTGIDRWARLPRRLEEGYQGALNKAEFQKREAMYLNNMIASNMGVNSFNADNSGSPANSIYLQAQNGMPPGIPSAAADAMPQTGVRQQAEYAYAQEQNAQAPGESSELKRKRVLRDVQPQVAAESVRSENVPSSGSRFAMGGGGAKPSFDAARPQAAPALRDAYLQSADQARSGTISKGEILAAPRASQSPGMGGGGRGGMIGQDKEKRLAASVKDENKVTMALKEEHGNINVDGDVDLVHFPPAGTAGPQKAPAKPTAAPRQAGQPEAAKRQMMPQQQAAMPQQQVMPARQSFQIGLPKPIWMGDKLLLARRATVAGQVFLQGAWLDWNVVRRMLLDEIRDLLPEARLEPVMQAAPSGPHDRMMAALPARLVPGPLRLADVGTPSPLRASLAVAWGCVAVALVALGGLLAGALALGERRRTFVSAVTHELRTPLTTFRMYTEMLAGGMVTDEGKRRRYLETLSAEAGRLTHLVENVLAYARLEAGRPGGRSELVVLGELMERIGERLGERARQGCMKLAVEFPGGEWDAATRLRLDPTAVEQILVNLVDNACKYGAAAGERAIRVEARRQGESVELRVNDHGPGVAPEDARKLFRPFSRSARDAAGNAPGVGLGLALSRRLARAMGGELRLDEDYREGACFVLSLPVR